MSTISFLTFGDGVRDLSSHYKAAANRLSTQAAETGWFDYIYCLDFDKLAIQDSSWCANHYDFIHSNRRGFGYWIWKPLTIYLTLRGMREGDFLVYADCGYEISPAAGKIFTNYIELAGDLDIVAWRVMENMSRWTKNDLFGYFDISRTEFFGCPMVQSGLLIIKKTKVMTDFFRNFLVTCTQENYHLVDDSPSVTQNSSDFIEHRHDQSLFNCLLYCYDISRFLDSDDYHPELWNKGLYRSDLPFHCFRNISATRRIIRT